MAETIGSALTLVGILWQCPIQRQSSEHPNTVTYFCPPHALLDYKTFEHVTADVPHFID